MGIIETGLKIAAGGLVGYMLAGGSCTESRAPYIQGMKLQEENGKVQLYHAPEDATYKVNIIDDKVFLGDAAHNAIGFQKMTVEELKQQYKGD